MLTKENRIRYNCDKLRYPSDLIDAEWSLIEPLIPPAKRGGNKRRVNLREIVNGGRHCFLAPQSNDQRSALLGCPGLRRASPGRVNRRASGFLDQEFWED